MEKIYSENRKKESGFKKIINSSFSVKCSFVLAFVTAFSVLFSTFAGATTAAVSYAIPDVENNLPDTFTSAKTNIKVWATGSDRFQVWLKKIKDGQEVFCIDQRVEFLDNVPYKKSGQIEDYGLLYLLANSYPNKEFKKLYANGTYGVYTDDKVVNNAIQSWITQMSIWLYQHEIQSDTSTFTADDIKLLESVTTVNYLVGSGQPTVYVVGNVYKENIRPLVDAAKQHRNIPNKQLNMALESNNVTLDADKKFFKTSYITVTGTPVENFNSYDLIIDKMPEGTLVIDENGNEIKNVKTDSNKEAFIAANFTNNSKFYLKIPVDKITDSTKDITIKALGSFKTYEGTTYISEGSQKVVAVNSVNNNLATEQKLTIDYTPDIPDTSANNSVIIYLVSLLVIVTGFSSIVFVTKKSM